ncbi:NAD(P)-dependent dehydrogenase (short-subunit alcohol dehydrogenase family) [Sphingomonas faeni]|uniref:NAD(P)-dependent dehydrogenase (Short-subunit alcohol dehydrogenase family) n=1 Tax=Sphingomonas faeni TaxID=185950 RepID=A0A2T5UAK9_9SPHN|nr:NAD(P)-dependent dehydrogenase (short-subunit alcohol dehydrogenase family) [Sphingomonas faeni]
MTALHGKIALVIGGTRGIGAAITRRLAADGASLAVIYRSRADDARLFVRGIEDGGRAVFAVQTDVSAAAALRAAIDTVIARYATIDILVNVAGMSENGTLASYADDAFERVFAVNVRAPFIAAQRVAAAMPTGGRIITIGSIVADRAPGEGVTLYAASKSALAGMTRGLARDLGARGITANLVQPGRSTPNAILPTAPMRRRTGRRLPSVDTARLTRWPGWSPISHRTKRGSLPARYITSTAAGARDRACSEALPVSRSIALGRVPSSTSHVRTP